MSVTPYELILDGRIVTIQIRNLLIDLPQAAIANNHVRVAVFRPLFSRKYVVSLPHNTFHFKSLADADSFVETIHAAVSHLHATRTARIHLSWANELRNEYGPEFTLNDLVSHLNGAAAGPAGRMVHETVGSPHARSKKGRPSETFEPIRPNS